MRRVLVVGATRILRPAVVSLAAEGVEVLAVARTAPDVERLAAEIPGVTALAADRADLGDVSLWRDRDLWKDLDAALVYAPALTDPAPGRLAPMVAGPVVHVITSAAAAPIGGDRGEDWSLASLPPPPAPNVTRLLLGWTDRSGGQSTWHTPAQISAAALAVLKARPHPADTVLGVVRPWAARPG